MIGTPRGLRQTRHLQLEVSLINDLERYIAIRQDTQRGAQILSESKLTQNLNKPNLDLSFVWKVESLVVKMIERLSLHLASLHAGSPSFLIQCPPR